MIPSSICAGKHPARPSRPANPQQIDQVQLAFLYSPATIARGGFVEAVDREGQHAGRGIDANDGVRNLRKRPATRQQERKYHGDAFTGHGRRRCGCAHLRADETHVECGDAALRIALDCIRDHGPVGRALRQAPECLDVHERALAPAVRLDEAVALGVVPIREAADEAQRVTRISTALAVTAIQASRTPIHDHHRLRAALVAHGRARRKARAVAGDFDHFFAGGLSAPRRWSRQRSRQGFFLTRFS